MNELKEPIVTIEPLLGLGEGEYEPSKLWLGNGASGLVIAPTSYGICYDTEDAALFFTGCGNACDVPTVTQKAKEQGFSGVHVVNVRGERVESWPV